MRKKFVLGVVTVILLVASSCNDKAEPELYLIPAGFAGKVDILFSKTAGVPPVYEGRRRIYRIPDSGILLTRFKFTAGVEDRQYYAVDEKGKRTLLKIFRYDHNKDGSIRWIVSNKNEKGIFMDGISGQYGNDGDPKSVYFEEFVVSSYNELHKFNTSEYEKAFDLKIDKITGLKLTL